MSPTQRPSVLADAEMRARALARWEGEGGALGRSGPPADALEDSELRILARVGAAALAEWGTFGSEQRDALLRHISRPLAPGDGARAKAQIAGFLREHGHR